MSDSVIFTRAQFKEAADAIAAQTRHRPRVALILGSGLNPLADAVAGADIIPYAAIPYFPPTSVQGHVGRLVSGWLADTEILVMQGRFHGYEGLSAQQLAFPIRALHEFGIQTLVVTNAAGGVNPEFRAGDLMLITDHIGLAAMTGQSPLWGHNDDSLGPRFLDMSRAYDPALCALARQVAAEQGIGLREGIYCGLAGPTFETPAEVRFLRLIGADAVGMSTVSEVIVARHMGMRVLGLSGISNVAIASTESQGEADHEEVLQAGRMIGPQLLALIEGMLKKMG